MFRVLVLGLAWVFLVQQLAGLARSTFGILEGVRAGASTSAIVYCSMDEGLVVFPEPDSWTVQPAAVMSGILDEGEPERRDGSGQWDNKM